MKGTASKNRKPKAKPKAEPEDWMPAKLVIRYSYDWKGRRGAEAYLRKHGRTDLIDLWKDTWQDFMIIFEANTLFRQNRKKRGFGTTKRKAGNH